MKKFMYYAIVIAVLLGYLILLGIIEKLNSQTIDGLEAQVRYEQLAPKLCEFHENKDSHVWPCTRMSERYFYAHG